MPTINQLVRSPRKSKAEKSESPALNRGYNSKRKKKEIFKSEKVGKKYVKREFESIN